MNIIQDIKDQPKLNQLYIKSIVLSFALLQINLPFKLLHPYVKYVSQKPLTKINLVGKYDFNGKYNKVGIGGTFDQLHIGHQILLITAIMLSKNQVFIGVVNDKMLQKKKNKSIIQPCHVRMQKIKQYINMIVPQQNKLNIIIQQINDPFGPTIIDDQFDALVVSQQTIRGGQKINQIRKYRNMTKLHIKICPALSPQSQQSNIQNKASSSRIRQYILDKNNMNQQEFIKYKSQWKNLTTKLYQYIQLQYNQVTVQKWWFIILDYYSQYWRYYHTNYHINTMLKQFNNNQYQLTQIQQILVLLSIWFHDIYYVPSESSNQEKSANIYQSFILQVFSQKQISQQKKNILLNNVKMAIISTKHHKPQNKVQQILIDLDMAILDTSIQQYKTYAKLIQRQFRPLVKQRYNQKRSQFLLSVNPSSVFTIRKPINIQTNIKWQIQNLKQNSQL